MDQEVRILCVDDEKSVLKSLERLFLDTDYKIITAASGGEGLEILKNTESIQLVVSDYRMPGMNGVDFLKEVCRIRPDTVRIVLSGYADTAAIVEAINEGNIYKFIPKPWNDDDLKVTISKALEHYFTNRKNIILKTELESKERELREINKNIERIVEERTSDLMLQNRILTASQNILDALPVGVISLDPGGLVVQCNRKGQELLNENMGMDSRGSFPEKVNVFIDSATEKGALSGYIAKNGSRIKVRGIQMKYPGGQEGIILVLDKGSNGSG